MNKRRVLLAGLCGAPFAAFVPFPVIARTHRPALTDLRGSGYFPNALLRTHDGKTVRFYDDVLKGKTVIINMMYTSCTATCPASTANLLEVQNMLGRQIGRDVFMYSITVQPEFDDVRALRDYAQRYGIGRGWTLLTGSRDDIDVIRHRLGFFDPDPDLDANVQRHTGMIRIGNEKLHRWSMLPALANPRQIVRAVLNTV